MAATRNRPAPDPLAVLRTTLRRRLGEWLGEASGGRQVAVAFSGGRDSTALLHALVGLRAETGVLPSAVHVHHGLSVHAERWVAFAEKTCSDWAVPLVVRRVAVDRHAGLGLEGAAREARYRVFAELDADLLLLAHHRDDQAETLLFNLLRGAGVHGAAAMPALRHLPRGDSGVLLLGRPWLDRSRREIDAYVAACALDFNEDESNDDTRFSRNHLRHQILPLLNTRQTRASENLSAAARRFGEASALLDELAELDLHGAVAGEAVSWSALQALSETRQGNALRRWLTVAGAPPASEAALNEFLRQCRTAGEDRLVSQRFGEFTLHRWRGSLHRVGANARAFPVARSWDGSSPVDWAGGLIEARPARGAGVRASLFAGTVELRPRHGGESLRLRAGGPTRPLRLLYQEMGVPPWWRDRLPYLWIDGRLAAVPGVGVAADFATGEGEAGVEVCWRST